LDGSHTLRRRAQPGLGKYMPSLGERVTVADSAIV
jgi:hypothetical protein